MAAVVWVGWFSPLFALESSRIDVAGLDAPGARADADAVRAAIASDVGTPLPRLDLGAMGDAVSGVDGVRSATVSRKWPDGVRVDVVPRIPVAAVPVGEEFALVDSDGVVVGAPVSDPSALPVVDVPVGEKNARILDAVVSVLAGLPASLSQRVASIGADTEDTIRMTLGDGTELVWGGVEDTALKAEVALALLESGIRAAVIDVSAPTLPVTHD